MTNFRGYLNDWWHSLRYQWRGSGPVVTWVIVALCLVVWLVEVAAQRFVPQAFQIMIYNGAFMPGLALAKPWTWLTAMFMHAPNFTHVLFNMLTLILIGPYFESMIGHWNFLVMYLICGLGGADGLMVYSLVTRDWAISAYGASGALFGLFAGVLVVGRRSGADIRGIAVCIAINFAMPLIMPNVAWQDHVGGFLIGFVFNWLLIHGVPALRRRSLNVRVAVYGVPMVALLVAIMVVCVYAGGVAGLVTIVE